MFKIIITPETYEYIREEIAQFLIKFLTTIKIIITQIVLLIGWIVISISIFGLEDELEISGLYLFNYSYTGVQVMLIVLSAMMGIWTSMKIYRYVRGEKNVTQ